MLERTQPQPTPLARLVALAASRRGDLTALLVLLGLAVALRAALLLRAPVFITNDSLSYLLPGFDLVVHGSFDPIYKRPPGYPLFVALAVWLFGTQDLLGLLTLQHLLGVVQVGLAWALGLRLFGRPAAFLAGLMTAVSGPLLITEHYLMSETLFGTLLLASLLVLLAGPRAPAWLGLAGLLLGLAALTRPVAQMLLPLYFLVALARLPRWRPALLAIVLVTAAYALVTLPWLARNAVVQGSATLAGGLGEGLAVRTIRLDQEFRFRPPGDRSDPLREAREVYREEARQGSAFELARRLREEADLSPAAADRAMRDIALEAIRDKPLYYLTGSLEMFGAMFAGRPVRLRQDWQPWRGIEWEERVQHLLPAPTPFQESQRELVEALVTFYDPARWPVATIGLFLAGCLAAARRSTDRLLAVAPGAVAVALLLVSALLVGIEWRYRYPLDPLIDVTMAGGAVAIWQALARGLRRLGPGRPGVEPLAAERA